MTEKVSSLTYSTNPGFPKHYVKRSRRKVLTKYSNVYPSCHRTLFWKHLLQKNFVWSLVRIFTMRAPGLLDLQLW